MMIAKRFRPKVKRKIGGASGKPSQISDTVLLDVIRRTSAGVSATDIARDLGLTASRVRVLRQRVIADDLRASGALEAREDVIAAYGGSADARYERVR